VKMSFGNSLSFLKNRLPTFLKLHDACRVDVARKLSRQLKEKRVLSFCQKQVLECAFPPTSISRPYRGTPFSLGGLEALSILSILSKFENYELS
jgi:hypothetical protein